MFDCVYMCVHYIYYIYKIYVIYILFFPLSTSPSSVINAELPASLGSWDDERGGWAPYLLRTGVFLPPIRQKTTYPWGVIKRVYINRVHQSINFKYI